MVFHVKVAYNMETIKIAKPTKIIVGNPRSDYVQVWSRKRLIITLKFTLKYILMIFTMKVE